MQIKESAGDTMDMDRWNSVVLLPCSTAFESGVLLQGKQEEAPMQNSSPRGVLDKPLHSLSTMTTDDGLRAGLHDNDNEPLQQSGRVPSFSMEHDDHSTEEEDPSEDESCLRRSARNHGTDRLHNSPREKRKVGRPIIYSGDPDAPDLTPQERRRIRRRIANRESARRVRAKRQDLIEEMSIKAQEMQELNAKLLARAQSVEQKHNLMAEHVAQMSECLKQKTRENETLQAELEAFRKSIKERTEGASSKSSGMSCNMQAPAFPGAPQQPSQPTPSTIVTSGATGVLQTQLPQRLPAGDFGYSAFTSAAQAPPMDALEMQLACMQGMPFYGSPLQLQPSGKDLLPMPQVQAPKQEGTMLPNSLPNPARLLSKELSLEGIVGSLSMDRSLSEFLHEVTCL